MGREIRRVPPNWEHPVNEENGHKVTMYDETFEQAATAWLAEFDRIRAGVDLTDFEKKWYPLGVVEWANSETPPNPELCRPWSDEEATWYQVWETVTEGTPVSPPFETKEELIVYLAENGDFWDQTRCWEDGWTRLWGGTHGVSAWGRARAENFVALEWAPSMVIVGDRILRTGEEF